MSDTKPLSTKHILAYVLPAIPTAALSVPLTVYIPPLYAENTLLTLGLVGTLFTLSKFIDVITDPLFGWLSDRVWFRWGRRRVWIILAVPLVMVSVHQLFHPPADAGASYLLLWLFVVYLGYTILLLSHLAWGAELAATYDERSRIIGWRQAVGTAGMLMVLILPAIGELGGLIEGAAGRADLMSRFVLITLPISVAITAFTLPDPLPKVRSATSRMSDLLVIFRNRHLRRILSATLLLDTAIGITGSLYVWLTVYVFLLPDLTSLILVVYFGSGTVFVPLWMALAKRFEKHHVYSGAMVYGMVTLAFFGVTSGAHLAVIMAANIFYGVAFGAGIFLARSMIADAADHDQLDYGQSRMGFFFSGLTLTGKLGFALGPAIAYNLLEQVGFDPTGAVSTGASNWLLFTFIVPPALLLGAAGIVMRKHTLTRARHAQIRAELDAV